MTKRDHTDQRGAILLALVVVLLLAASIALISRANRVAPAASLQLNAQRDGLDELLSSIRQQLITKAALEDNTPGTMPCPDGSNSCGVTIAGLSGTANANGVDFDASILVSLPDQDSSKVCTQYILAPSLRNFLQTDTRGGTQKAINPDLTPDLTVIDSAGRTSKAWAALLANAPVTTCSLSSLGYSLSVTSEASLSAATSSASAARLSLIQTRDILPALYTQVLQTLDTPTLQSYLNAHTTTTKSLAILRVADPDNFDAALAPPPTILVKGGSCSSSASAVCPEVLAGAPSSCATSSSLSTTAKVPVSWLCFNKWYDYVSYDPSSKTFIATDTASGLKCLRKSGVTTCSY